jgi:hypothetical protein
VVGAALLYAGAGSLARYDSLWAVPGPAVGTVDLTSWNHWPLPTTENGTLPTDDERYIAKLTAVNPITNQGDKLTIVFTQMSCPIQQTLKKG